MLTHVFEGRFSTWNTAFQTEEICISTISTFARAANGGNAGCNRRISFSGRTAAQGRIYRCRRQIGCRDRRRVVLAVECPERGSPFFGPSRTGCQGVQGEWRMTTLRVGMKGVGETSLSRAESPLRVWESWASPKVAAGGQGPGARPWRTRSSNAEPKGRSASCLVSK